MKRLEANPCYSTSFALDQLKLADEGVSTQLRTCPMLCAVTVGCFMCCYCWLCQTLAFVVLGKLRADPHFTVVSLLLGDQVFGSSLVQCPVTNSEWHWFDYTTHTLR